MDAPQSGAMPGGWPISATRYPNHAPSVPTCSSFAPVPPLDSLDTRHSAEPKSAKGLPLTENFVLSCTSVSAKSKGGSLSRIPEKASSRLSGTSPSGLPDVAFKYDEIRNSKPCHTRHQLRYRRRNDHDSAKSDIPSLVPVSWAKHAENVPKAEPGKDREEQPKESEQKRSDLLRIIRGVNGPDKTSREEAEDMRKNVAEEFIAKKGKCAAGGPVNAPLTTCFENQQAESYQANFEHGRYLTRIPIKVFAGEGVDVKTTMPQNPHEVPENKCVDVDNVQIPTIDKPRGSIAVPQEQASKLLRPRANECIDAKKDEVEKPCNTSMPPQKFGEGSEATLARRVSELEARLAASIARRKLDEKLSNSRADYLQRFITDQATRCLHGQERHDLRVNDLQSLLETETAGRRLDKDRHISAYNALRVELASEKGARIESEQLRTAELDKQNRKHCSEVASLNGRLEEMNARIVALVRNHDEAQAAMVRSHDKKLAELFMQRQESRNERDGLERQVRALQAEKEALAARVDALTEGYDYLEISDVHNSDEAGLPVPSISKEIGPRGLSPDTETVYGANLGSSYIEI